MFYDIYLRDYLIDIGANSQFGILHLLMSLHTLGNWVLYSDCHYYFVTPIIEVMYNVHREYYIILTAILVVILYVLCVELIYFRDLDNRYSINNNFILELVWSILPALIILHFMVMTIALLYISDEHTFFGFQVKVIGHQWYWEYDVAKCFSSIESVYTYMTEAVAPRGKAYRTCDGHILYTINAAPTYYLILDKLSFMNPYIDVSHGTSVYSCDSSDYSYDSQRLIDTEGVLYVPYHTHVRLLVTSMDVIHSFTIPSLGIKADAIPGRLNDLHFFLTDNAAMTHYFGQCSELCGVGHAFMPVHMVSI